MAGIFISHSSKNNAEAERLRDWLAEQGWGRSQVFLDLQDLKSGDRWRDVLNGMADCEAVIVCLSNEWLGSSECIREFTQAEERGKAILPVFVAPVTVPIPRFVTDVQIGDTSPEGIGKLRDQLLAKRITPQSFLWPPKDEPARSVYRGLQAMDVQDAAIFFGRDADIARGLDELRILRNGAPQRMLVILGASGSGKSSFLRAGLIARLKRDEENFLVLPIVRPERAAISGAQGLAAAIGRPVSLNSAGDLAQAFAELRKPVMERLTRIAEAARETHAAKPPTIIIPLDQAEELFGADNTESAAFREMVAGAIAQDGNVLLVATIRSDSYEALQNGLMPEGQNTFSLPAIPAGSFKEIIEGPARLANPPLVVEPALTQQLLADLDAADALPLLAFTLERLQSQYGADGKLTLADYRDKLGGLSGAIQSAVYAVLGAQPSKDQLALARRLFVPALVQVDQDGVKRRVSRRADLPAETQGLADQFIMQRLLVSDDGKVEVAHEAILRQWPALAGWIAEERGALVVLDSVRAATREWREHHIRRDGRGGESWLAHRGDRLKEAEGIAARRDLVSAVDIGMMQYLRACRVNETGRLRSRRRSQALVALLALAVLGAGYAYTQRDTLEPLVISWAKYKRFAHSTRELTNASAGTTFQDCQQGSPDCPVMVVIPEGTFLMGSIEGDASASADEFPQRRISVGRVAISQNEITFANWRACFEAGACGNEMPTNEGWDGDNRPLINVSWRDAERYVQWLSQVTGQDYRLLREVEWEYAARAHTALSEEPTRYSWGNDEPVCARDAPNGATFEGCFAVNLSDDPAYASTLSAYNRASDAGERLALMMRLETMRVGAMDSSRQAETTFPVGSFHSNAFGLFDMHGNVAEWVSDCYELYGASTVAESARECSRVTRGGHLRDPAISLRSAARGHADEEDRSRLLGFRVARSVSSRPPQLLSAPPASGEQRDLSFSLGVNEQRGWLGLTPIDLGSTEARSLGISATSAVQVAAVTSGGPAEQAGLLPGDVILSVSDSEVRSGRDVYLAVRSLFPGQRVDLEVLRDGRRRSVTVIVGRPPE